MTVNFPGSLPVSAAALSAAVIVIWAESLSAMVTVAESLAASMLICGSADVIESMVTVTSSSASTIESSFIPVMSMSAWVFPAVMVTAPESAE